MYFSPIFIQTVATFGSKKLPGRKSFHKKIEFCTWAWFKSGILVCRTQNLSLSPAMGWGLRILKIDKQFLLKTNYRPWGAGKHCFGISVTKCNTTWRHSTFSYFCTLHRRPFGLSKLPRQLHPFAPMGGIQE